MVHITIDRGAILSLRAKNNTISATSVAIFMDGARILQFVAYQVTKTKIKSVVLNNIVVMILHGNGKTIFRFSNFVHLQFVSKPTVLTTTYKDNCLQLH